MNPWIQVGLVFVALIVVLQVNTFIVTALQSRGHPMTRFPLNLMLKIHASFGEFDQWLGRVLRAYGQFVDTHGGEIADRTFKMLGWILIAGTVRAIAHISDHWLLRVLSYAVFFVLGLALAQPTSKLTQVIRDRSLSRFKISFPIAVLIGLVIWFIVVTTLWIAISLLIEDITNFLPPATDDSVNSVGSKCVH